MEFLKRILCSIVVIVVVMTTVVSPHPMTYQLEALRAFYNTTGGSHYWPKHWRENWLNNEITHDACHPWTQWRGSECHRNKIFRFQHCSGFATGSLPNELSHLEHLKIFDVARNRLVGTLPDVFVKWREISAFIVSGNRLNGTLPKSLGGGGSPAPPLRFLRLDENDFSGTIPATWVAFASTLEAIFLNDNAGLSGTIPTEFNDVAFPQLRHVQLHNLPALSGTLPTSWTSRATNLMALTTHRSGIPAQLTIDVVLPQPYLIYLTVAADDSEEGKRVVRDADTTAPLRFLGIGDFGTGGDMFWMCKEVSGARAFNEFAGFYNASFVFTVGDNFYNGNTPWRTLEEYFHESFEKLYSSDAMLHTPWYVGLGNHDSRSQFGYSKRSSRWKQEGSLNVVHSKEGLVDLLIHDEITGTARKYKATWNWLNTQLGTSRRRLRNNNNNSDGYTLIAAHYPIVSTGCHQTLATARDANVLVSNHRPHAYFAGHDHHLEALQVDGVYHFLIGGFAREPCTKNAQHPNSLWVERFYGGFVVVTADDVLLNVTFVSQYGSFMNRTTIPIDAFTRHDPFVDVANYTRRSRTRRMSLTSPSTTSSAAAAATTTQTRTYDGTFTTFTVAPPVATTAVTTLTVTLDATTARAGTRFFVSTSRKCTAGEMVAGHVAVDTPKVAVVKGPLPAGTYFVCAHPATAKSSDPYVALEPAVVVVTSTQGGGGAATTEKTSGSLDGRPYLMMVGGAVVAIALVVARRRQ
eukprot:PhM_4_TR16113/c0_g1_i1/m.88389